MLERRRQRCRFSGPVMSVWHWLTSAPLTACLDRLDKSDDSNKSRFKSSLCALPLYEGELSSASP